jgi:ATP-dependent protease ClpP protease subunit
MQKSEFRLVVGDFIFQQQVAHYRNQIAQIIERPDFGELTLLLSSEGGSTDQSVAFYNFLRQLPVPVHIHATGHVGSAANIVYQAGHRRTAATFSRFFFHQYDWGFDQRQTFRGLEEAVQRLQADIGMAQSILKEHTRLTDEFLAALDGQSEPKILNPAQAVGHGVADQVLDLPKKRDDDLQVQVWT